MNEIEILLTPILIVGYGAICYMCGKGDLLNVVALMLQDTGNSLREFLGMTEEEYLNFVLGKTTAEEE